MVICGHCQSQNSTYAKFCGKCGAALRTPTGPGKPQASWKKPASGVEAETLVERPLVAKIQGHRPVQKVSAKPALRHALAPSSKVSALEKKIPEARARERVASDTAIDVEPLMAEEAKARVADQLDRAQIPALAVWLNFPRALIAGYGSIVEAKIENTGKESLEHLSVMLESNGLAESIEVMCRHIGPGNWTRKQIELTPVKAGTFVLRCNVKSARAAQAYAFRGGVPITINVVPDPANFV